MSRKGVCDSDVCTLEAVRVWIDKYDFLFLNVMDCISIAWQTSNSNARYIWRTAIGSDKRGAHRVASLLSKTWFFSLGQARHLFEFIMSTRKLDQKPQHYRLLECRWKETVDDVVSLVVQFPSKLKRCRKHTVRDIQPAVLPPFVIGQDVAPVRENDIEMSQIRLPGGSSPSSSEEDSDDEDGNDVTDDTKHQVPPPVAFDRRQHFERLAAKAARRVGQDLPTEDVFTATTKTIDRSGLFQQVDQQYRELKRALSGATSSQEMPKKRRRLIVPIHMDE